VLYYNYFPNSRSRVSSGSIVSDYWLDDRAIEVRSPAGAKDFSSSLCVQTGCGAHPASCPMGTGVPFLGGKSAAGAWCWPLTPIWCRGQAWVGAIPPLPPSACMTCSGTALPSFPPNNSFTSTVSELHAVRLSITVSYLGTSVYLSASEQTRLPCKVLPRSETQSVEGCSRLRFLPGQDNATVKTFTRIRVDQLLKVLGFVSLF
jgi:hypothetical protein